MISKLIMFLCRIQYKKYGKSTLFIKGTGEDYPRFLIYTENEKAYKRMDEF